MALNETQLVTVPTLDARFSTLELRIDQVKLELLRRLEQIKSDLMRWIFLTMLANTVITAVIQRVH